MTANYRASRLPPKVPLIPFPFLFCSHFSLYSRGIFKAQQGGEAKGSTEAVGCPILQASFGCKACLPDSSVPCPPQHPHLLQESALPSSDKHPSPFGPKTGLCMDTAARRLPDTVSLVGSHPWSLHNLGSAASTLFAANQAADRLGRSLLELERPENMGWGMLI